MAVIFASDFSAAGTVGNFDSNTAHALVTCTREVGNGPTGNNTLRFVIASTAVNSQPNWGLHKALTDTVTQGSSRFYRLRLKYNGAPEFAGNNGPWYTKSCIIGADNVLGGGRVIVWTGVGAVDTVTPTYWISKNVGTKAATNLTVSAWNNIQCRMTSSSTSGALDGRVDLWLGADNTSVSTPTSSVTGLDIDLSSTNTWTNEDFVFGGEVDQTTLQNGVGHVDFNVCDLEWATTFDSNWNSPAGSSGTQTGRGSLMAIF
jgi:hypothetical protein